MITMKDSIEINAAPEKIFNCLVRFITDKESYKAWHPEHVDIKWTKGDPVKEGSIMYIEEYLQDYLYKIKFRITKIVSNKLIEYRPLFPLSIIALGNRFLIEPKGENSSVFTASGRIMFPLWLFLKMHNKHEGKLDASEQHMKEEGENLKRAVETVEA
jgi:hypothetical protein